MTVAAVVLALGPPSPTGRREGPRPEARRPSAERRRPPTAWRSARVAAAALESGLDETVVVLDTEERAGAIPEGATVLLDAAAVPGEATALRAALDWCARQGHDAVVLALEDPTRDDPAEDPAAWRALAAAPGGPVVVATRGGRRTGFARIDAEAWPLLPLEGAVAATWHHHPELVSALALEAPGASPAAAAAGEGP